MLNWNMKRLSLLVLTISGIFLSVPSFAADTPATLDGAKVPTVEEVQKLQSAGAMIVDTRIAAEYAESHIKGAVSVPYREKSAKEITFDASQDEFNLSKLPTDKASAVVFYCNGPACWKSYKGAVLAIKGGYTNVNWFRDGIPAWKAKNLPTE